MQSQTIVSTISGRVSRNIIFWLLIVWYYASSRESLWPAYPILLVVMFVSLGIPAYINNIILIPSLFIRRRYLQYAISLALLLLVTAGASSVIAPWINKMVPGFNYMGRLRGTSFLFHLIPSLTFLSFIGFGKFATDALLNERRLEQLEKERLSNELNSLRAQVNPHFLFNALNTVFGLARRQDVQTADAVIRLSDILRYGLYECEGEEPTVEREVYFLRQYVEFAKLRMHDKECISLVIDVQNAGNVRIAPMLLTPFVENAIKHGLYDTKSDGGIEVSLLVKNNELWFSCINRHAHAADGGMQPSGIYNGIGNKNVKRRLELLYPEKYALNINDANGHFLVELNIQLQ